ncbi:conserved hypothetical protein [Neospora caninum Liverpool]|uniref:BSD domain-containing protein n=1 Tax=Neospora caninum (strain Liverpool) TaxID=572307 RepID=F0VNM6_NEOCL|nr:conserved hypothetical protein [Neospora caninum Liverpool]CBZ55322.1 conserved hypothetical protein [Neospora caninum Liverpool]CEL70053.1 TPA: hypothetical protein BN1204_057450 [Neospora caninum Liverpool]|eukprot:XP_003885350.1 conserved hypothetical protein [Neospora caninum Liverpool]
MQKLQSPSSSSPKEAGLSREGRPGGLSSEADSEHPQQRALSPSAFSSSTTVPSSRGAHRENEERTLAAPPSNAASDKQTGAGFLGRVSQWTSLASLRTTGAETTNEAHASGMEAAAAQAKSGVSAAARVASSWGRWISQATSGLVEELQAEMAVSEELKEFCGTISRDSQRWMEEHQTVFPHLTSSTSASSTSAGSAHSRSRLPSVRGCLAPVSAGEERELGRAPSFPSRQAETSVSLSSSNASQTTGSQPASRADSSLAAAQPPPPPPAAALSSAAGLASLQSSRPPSLEESSEPLDREKGSLEPQTSPAMESVYSRFSSLLSSTSLLVATASDTARNVARGLTGNSPEAAGERERSGQSGQEEQRWRELKTEREEAGGRESVLPLKPFFGTAGAEREPSCPLADLERRLPPVIARGSSELRRQYAALIRSPATFLEDPTGHLVSLSRVPVSPPSSSAARQLNASESETAAERAAACSSPCSFPLPLEASWEAGLAAEREKREGASPVQECLFSPSHREEDAAPDFAAFHVEAYDDLLDFFHNPQVMEMRRQLVPHRVEESLFWRRLLFRVQLLCQDCSRSDSASRARVCEGEAKESFSEISRDKKEFSTGMREAEPSSPRPVPPHEPPSSLGIPRGSEMRGLMAELDEEDIAWDDDETGDSQEATEGGNPLASVFSSLRGPTLSPESEPGSCLQNESPRAALLAVEVSSSSSPTSPSSSLASPPLSSLSETPRVSSAAPHPPQSSTSPEPHQTLEVASTLSSPLVSVPKTHSPLPPASPSDCPPAAVCSFSAASSTQSALQPCPNGGLPVHLGSAARPGSRAQTTDAEVKLERDALQDASSTNLGACLPRPSSDSGRSACTLERPAATETQLPLEHGFHVVVSEARFRGCEREAQRPGNQTLESDGGDEEDAVIGDGWDDAGLVIL